MPELRRSAASGLCKAEVQGCVARENAKASATNDTLWGCDQCSTGWCRAQQPRGCVSESSAGGVPGSVLGEKRAFERPIPLNHDECYQFIMGAMHDEAKASLRRPSASRVTPVSAA